MSTDTRDVVREVQAYREYWKPSKTRVVLLAESHKQTMEDQFRHLLDLKALRRIPLRREGYPRHFVKFVYCLGYGQDSLLEEPLASNRGTPSYWKILYHCRYEMPASPGPNRNHDAVLSQTPLEERLANKVGLLEGLRESGIWLVDASTVGIAKLESKVKKRIIQHCWDESVADVIHSLRALEKIVVIGIGVSEALKSPLVQISKDGIEVTTIPQPEAVRTPGGYDQHLRTLFRICGKYRRGT